MYSELKDRKHRNRILIIGTAGSGKSTFANNVARKLHLSEIELDELNWRPNWENRQATDPEGFKQDVKQAIGNDNWVATGGYRSVRDILWEKADIIIWLDLPFLTVLQRVFRRSIARAFSKRETFEGCKENWRDLFAQDKPLMWSINSFYERRKAFEKMAIDEKYNSSIIYRCRNKKMVSDCFYALTGSRDIIKNF